MNIRSIGNLTVSLLVTGLAGIFAGCSEDNTTGPTVEGTELMLAQLIDNQTYLSPIKGLDDNTAGTELTNAIQEEISFPGPFMNGNDLFVGPLGSGGDLVKYTRDANGVVTENGRLTLGGMAWVSGMAFSSSSKAYFSSYSDQKIIAFNPATMTKIKEIPVAAYSSRTDALAMPAQMVVRDGKLYTCIHQAIDQMNIDTVMTVLIIDTQTDSIEKIINDSRASWAGAREGFPNIMIDDNNDIYVNGLAMFGMSTAPGVRAGILRIKSGSTDFDSDYFWAAATSTISGGMVSAFYGLVYAGGTKAYGFIIDMMNFGAGEDMTTARFAEPVLLDLSTKIITQLPLPATDGYAHNICIYGGKVLYCLNPKSETKGIYVYDPANGSVSVSAPAIPTAGIPVFVGAFY